MKQLENIKNKYPTTSWKAVMEGAVDLEDYVNNPMNCYDVAANLGGMKEISFDKVLQMKWLSELVKRKRADDTFHIDETLGYVMEVLGYCDCEGNFIIAEERLEALITKNEMENV